MHISTMNTTDKRIQFFRVQLAHWHDTQNFRSFPWKQEKDPYKIWLSEIILQQTRSEQGLPYYLNFVTAYPTVTDLADAEDEVVFRMWQGLGYYNRCKNLLFTARVIRDSYGGVFPEDYDTILKLKGIGTYTAAAIASFAYNAPYAVLDGNVFRVLARYEGISTAIDSTEGKKVFSDLAARFLDEKRPALYNQAIMDLGATVCTPQKPDCMYCTLQQQCAAYRQNTQALLPVKSKKIQIKHRTFLFFVCSYQDTIYIQKRGEGDIWQNLYEFYRIEETDGQEAFREFGTLFDPYLNTAPVAVADIQQKLTHQHIRSVFYEAELNAIPAFLEKASFVPVEKLKNFAFPKTIISFLDNKYYF